MKSNALYRFSSVALLAFAFIYSAVYIIQVHRLLPHDSVTLLDPYGEAKSQLGGPGKKKTSAKGQGALEAWALATGGSTASGELHTMPGLALSAGEAAPPGQALSFSGTGFTVATWLKPRRQRSATQCLASFGQEWALVLKPSGCPAFVMRQAGKRPMEYITVLDAPVAEWTHLAVSYDGSHQEAVLYMNGSRTSFSTVQSQVQAASCCAHRVVTSFQRLPSHIIESAASHQHAANFFSVAGVG